MPRTHWYEQGSNIVEVSWHRATPTAQAPAQGHWSLLPAVGTISRSRPLANQTVKNLNCNPSATLKCHDHPQHLLVIKLYAKHCQTMFPLWNTLRQDAAGFQAQQLEAPAASGQSPWAPSTLPTSQSVSDTVGSPARGWAARWCARSVSGGALEWTWPLHLILYKMMFPGRSPTKWLQEIFRELGFQFYSFPLRQGDMSYKMCTSTIYATKWKIMSQYDTWTFAYIWHEQKRQSFSMLETPTGSKERDCTQLQTKPLPKYFAKTLVPVQFGAGSAGRPRVGDPLKVCSSFGRAKSHCQSEQGIELVPCVLNSFQQCRWHPFTGRSSFGLHLFSLVWLQFLQQSLQFFTSSNVLTLHAFALIHLQIILKVLVDEQGLSLDAWNELHTVVAFTFLIILRFKCIWFFLLLMDLILQDLKQTRFLFANLSIGELEHLLFDSTGKRHQG